MNSNLTEKSDLMSKTGKSSEKKETKTESSTHRKKTVKNSVEIGLRFYLKPQIIFNTQ